jgi:hypothetical protein
MDAINSTAFGDTLTGVLPNNRFGNGRLDAFAALNSSNFSVSITGGGELCSGDSALVEGPPTYTSYVWTDGSDTQNAWSQGEDMAVIVTNDGGCSSYSSDTVSFTVLPAPAVPVITANGVDLTSSPANNYQWLLNGTPIIGANAQQWSAEANGDYTVLVVDSNGCSALSDSVTILSVGVDAVAAGSGFRVWPVPAHGMLNVELPFEGNISYVVIDAGGRAVGKGTLRGGSVRTISIADLVPGTYVLEVVDSGEAVRQSFVVR